MKKSAAAILITGTVVVSALIAACGQPAPAAPAAIAANQGTTAQAYLGTAATVGPVAPTDEERMMAMQSSIGMLINESVNCGQAVPEYLYQQSQKIEQVRQTLRQLDGQREGLSVLLMQYYATGVAAPDCVFDLLNSVEESRQENLKEIGLSQ